MDKQDKIQKEAKLIKEILKIMLGNEDYKNIQYLDYFLHEEFTDTTNFKEMCEMGIEEDGIIAHAFIQQDKTLIEYLFELEVDFSGFISHSYFTDALKHWDNSFMGWFCNELLLSGIDSKVLSHENRGRYAKKIFNYYNT